MSKETVSRWLPALTALALFAGLATTARGQGLSFESPREYPVGTSPQWLAAVDLNRDGVLDLAVTNAGSGTVSVLLGIGNGQFQAASHYPAGASPNSLVVADFNGDSLLDVATSNYITQPGNVSLLLGNGDGTLRPPLTILGGGNRPYTVAAGDFNHDGNSDMALANFGDNAPTDTTVTVLLGNGNGTFQTARVLQVQRGPLWVSVADLNGDGAHDIVTANFGGTDTVSVLLGNNDGTFQSARNFPAGSGPSSVAAGDFDGDGRLDLAVADYHGNQAAVLRGNGDGTFQAPQLHLVGVSPTSVVVGDLDGDGPRDVVAANWDGNAGQTFSILRGNGNGTFQLKQDVTAGRGVVGAIMADLDADGALDVVTANYNAGTVSVLINNGAPQTSHTLTVGKAGTGSGTVTSIPAGINCGADCSEPYTTGTVVTLTASPAGGSTFSGWSGAGCSGTGTCTVTMTAAASVTATFTAQTANHTLTVSKAGTGSGTVTSNPAGINCGADCSESYSAGTVVTLNASPAGGSNFSGWSGAGCSGTGTCSVTMTAAASVTATFTAQTANHTLSVGKAGTGSGTVTSNPAGINCGADCSESYSAGTVVTLTASPAGGSTFSGWSGAGCSGTGTCSVTMNASASVTATFTAQTANHTLNVGKAGTGSGTVTSNPAGINCGSDCSESYSAGTVVTLTASPAGGSNFSGWSGAGCAGTGTCSVTMNAAASVTATFTRQRFTLTVTRTGLGLGTVTSSPAGISCGSDCSETYDAGTVVVLTAHPGLLSAFNGWSGGGCSGTGTCTITIQANVGVNANFRLLGITSNPE